MPFGLSNVQSTFHRLMIVVLPAFIGKFLLFTSTTFSDIATRKTSILTIFDKFAQSLGVSSYALIRRSEVSIPLKLPSLASSYPPRNFSTVMAPITDCIKVEPFTCLSYAHPTSRRSSKLLATLRASESGVLSQEGHPIEFFSENLNDAQLSYSTYDKEFYVFVQTLKH
ncbi:uncharacterized protein LOC144707884 [Wolffia australiana]